MDTGQDPAAQHKHNHGGVVRGVRPALRHDAPSELRNQEGYLIVACEEEKLGCCALAH